MASTEMVVRDVKDNLAQAARAAEAAAPDDEAGDPAALDAEVGSVDKVDGDAGAPPNLLLSEQELKNAVKALEQGGLSQNKVIALVRAASHIEKQHAHKVGHRRGFLHGLEHARARGRGGRRWEEDPAVHWRRSPQMHEFREDIINRYERRHGGHVRQGLGYYYSTIEVQMEVQGTPSDAAFVLSVPTAPDNPVINQCFNYGIDDVVPTWFAGPHTANAGDTNLQEPGQGLYQDELFIIEACGAYMKGIRIAYPTPATTFNPVPTNDILSALSGQELIWDRAGRILPTETFNLFDDSCEIAKAVAEASTFYFNWLDKAIGGDKGQNTKLVDRFCRIPSVGRRGFRETSGGGLSHDLPRGYIWCVDKLFQANSDMGGNGLFNAELHTDESVVFPFQPIPLFGSGGPVLPTGLALYWQFVVYGTSLVPARDTDRYEGQPRKRM
jgi:hypothetical protein